MTKARIRLQRVLRPYGKDAFISGLALGARVFDIGCGNRSPERTKALRPDLYYVGLDVQDYGQSRRALGMADEYRIVAPADFNAAVAAESRTMDAVISAHNLEHCDDPMAVIRAMAGALKPGGKLYLSFPCEASVDFPSRRGTLRFADDPTHRAPPVWARVLDQLSACGLTTEVAIPRYRPVVPAALGLLLEPVSALGRRVMPLGSTWSLWGFESVVWATKNATEPAG